MYFFVYWGVYLLLKPFYRFKFIGREKLPEGPCVVCANHTALVDSIFLVLSMGRKGKFVIMAKAELFKFKPFGALLKWLNVFPANRGKGDMTAVKTGIKALNEDKKLLIFPEGTRVRSGQVSEPKTGAAMFAIRKNVPVVPVYITAGKKFLKGADIVFGDPFMPDEETAKAKDYAGLTEEIMRRIKEIGGSYKK